MSKTVKYTVAGFLSSMFNLIVVNTNAFLHYTDVHPDVGLHNLLTRAERRKSVGSRSHTCHQL